MVQMKARKSLSRLCKVSLLYIPHGSDERMQAYTYAMMLPFFISHMVQMKDEEAAEVIRNDAQLYIPHGSDERYFI